jgi:Kelch motif protein/galactose oxidase-like protein
MKRFLLTIMSVSAAFSIMSAPARGATPFGFGNAAGGTWMTTGSLAAARVSPMAATLPSGKVLVAGGFNRSTFASAELYDPTTGRWSPTGSMKVARYNATMTLLASGKVLVAGGLISSFPGVTAKAELYDPATGGWSATGSMHDPRGNHTATLLSNGEVVIAGGVGVSQNQTFAIASAEIYNPARGTWSRTASMSTPRERHSANRLPNGDVLVSGGNLDYLDGAEGSAETYHSQTGTWSVVGRMTTSRLSHSATALADGSLLVAGGAYGNFAAFNPLASADRYDPSSGRWLQTGDMQIDHGSIPTISGRKNHTATLLLDGRVLVAGGDGYLKDFTSDVIFSSAELFDPQTGGWTLTGRMNKGRSEHAAVALLDGRVLVAGGSGVGVALASAEIFTPSVDRFGVSTNFGAAEAFSGAPRLGRRAAAMPTLRRPHGVIPASRLTATTGMWTGTGSMHVARVGAPAVLLSNGKVLVEGCDANLFIGGTTAELYDPTSGTWSLTGSMSVSRCGHSAILLRSGRVLVASGANEPDVWSSSEIYDPTTGRWTLTRHMNSTRLDAAMVMLSNGSPLIAGGAAANGIPRDSADVYYSGSGAWAETPSLNVSRWSHAAAVLRNGKVMVYGGFTQNNSITLTSELYDPATNAWTLSGSTEQQSLRIVTLKSGKVLSTDEPGNAPTGTTSELYDPSTGKWTPTLGKMTYPRVNDAVVRLADGRVIVSGGCFGLQCSFIAQAEIFTPSTQMWSLDAPLITPREVHSSVLLADGRVLVAGGYDANLNPLKSAELFTTALKRKFGD